MILSGLFVVSVILIWFVIAYQLILTVAGFFYNRNSMKRKKEIDGMNPIDYPSVCVLIPAHNEEKVIAQTLESMLHFDYPKNKIKIMVINDGSSDRTGEIVKGIAQHKPQVIYYEIPKYKGGKGKSIALNLGLKHTDAEVIAVYDADNRPSPDALKYLVTELILHPDLGAVIGKFRTINHTKNWLTRFINIETLSFQAILQAGRWLLFKVTTLPGTNFVIRRSLLDELGGWDEDALTEDSELSIRIYMKGYRIKYIPFALTFEQEPETIKNWVKQRTRWARGNNYVIAKFFKEIPKFQNKFLAGEILYLLSLYYVFLLAIAISDVIFFMSVTNIIAIPLPGPYTTIWVLAILLFVLEIWLVLSNEGHDSKLNMFLTVAMYFTYCQLWIYVVGRAVYLDYIKREKRNWDKTERVYVEEEYRE
jgi:cellulose synthase/poly-beta-1,6-N-acetylglucosamine synthase-like glycosyltransferase